MIITQIDLITVSVPLKKHLETSFGIISNRDTLIIKMYTKDRLIGYGESSLLSVPISELETISSGIELLRNKICPLIIGNNFDNIIDLKSKVLDKFLNCPVTKIGVEGAFYHLVAQKDNKFVGDIFGPQKDIIEVGETLGIDTVENVLKEAEIFAEKKYKYLKMKIKPGHDYEIVKMIRNKFANIELGVDANAAYSINQINIFKKLDNLNLKFIEQPFGSNEFDDHSILQKQINTPICLDESIKSLKDAKKAVSFKSCKIINIKPARIGSYYESKLIHDYCYNNGIGVFGGGRLESGVGKAFNVALAGLTGYNYPLDISSTLEYFMDDIVDPIFKVDDGKFKVKNKSGLGVEINESKLKKYSIDLVKII